MGNLGKGKEDQKKTGGESRKGPAWTLKIQILRKKGGSAMVKIPANEGGIVHRRKKTRRNPNHARIEARCRDIGVPWGKINRFVTRDGRSTHNYRHPPRPS